MRAGWVALAACLVMGIHGLQPGDPVGANVLWAHAHSVAGDDLSHPLFLDAARDLSAIRPWQEGYRDAQQRLRDIEAAR